MSKGRVLCVDDDSAVLRTYARILRAAEFEVHETEDGKSVVELLKASTFDTVVSDLSMPEITGLELLQAVRKHDLDVPVILLTGAPELESAMRAVEYGAFRYLAKPVNGKELVSVVTQATRMHQLALTKRKALEMLQLDQDLVAGWQMGDRASLEACFSSALGSLWMAYQPIVSWSGKNIHAFEALVRTTEPAMPNPGVLIDSAERLDRIGDLGHVIQRSVAATLAQMPVNAQIFVNLHVKDLLDGRMFSNDAPLDPFAARVVLEITERSSLHAVPDIQARVAALRAKGYRIAVDDLGAGYAGLTTFSLLEPDVVKLDMMLIRDIDTLLTKQKLVQSMVSLCKEMGALVVAEGVETEQEAATLVRLGCDLLQGYHFAKPARPFPTCEGF